MVKGPPLPTPIDPNRLDFWLQGYDKEKSEYLVNGFRHGFRSGFKGSVNSKIEKNLKSCYEHPELVDEYIQTELDAGRFVGPFDKCPFEEFQVSPIGLVEKSTPGKYRAIHHLSFPYGASINDGISAVDRFVQYSSVQDAIALVQKCGSGSFMSKCDIKKAYRIMPIHPDEYHLFVIFHDGKYYFDRSLEMGMSSSCRIFDEFSSALEWIGKCKLNIDLVHYLDDFFLANKSKNQCYTDLQSFSAMCSDIGVPLAPDKTVLPCQVVEYLGFEIDSVLQELRLPLLKVQKCVDLIQSMLEKGKRRATLKELQSLIGLLNFTCAVVLPGRPFLRRLINITCGLKSPWHHANLNKGVKEDLRVWLDFLKNYNGKCFFLQEKCLNSLELNLITDSCKFGYAGIFQNSYFYGSFPVWWQLQNITLLELYPIVLAVEIWVESFRNRKVLFHTDNKALVSVINKQTSREHLVMILIRRLVLFCLKNNIVVSAVHVVGSLNIADPLSRFQVETFFGLCPKAEPYPVFIPQIPESLDC